VGRYLEHSRIFHFHNNGREEVFIGSADWMQRNLDRRVEAVTPVEDPTCSKELKEILNILLADNYQAWELQSDGSYLQRQPTQDDPEHKCPKYFDGAKPKVARIIFTDISTLKGFDRVVIS